MPHALLDCDVIYEPPEQYLRSVGTVFAEFGALTQDSGNVSYGVQIAAELYFVKTAGRPDDPRPFLEHEARVALLRNAVRLSRSCRHSLCQDCIVSSNRLPVPCWSTSGSTANFSARRAPERRS